MDNQQKHPSDTKLTNNISTNHSKIDEMNETENTSIKTDISEDDVEINLEDQEFDTLLKTHTALTNNTTKKESANLNGTKPNSRDNSNYESDEIAETKNQQVLDIPTAHTSHPKAPIAKPSQPLTSEKQINDDIDDEYSIYNQLDAISQANTYDQTDISNTIKEDQANNNSDIDADIIQIDSVETSQPLNNLSHASDNFHFRTAHTKEDIKYQEDKDNSVDIEKSDLAKSPDFDSSIVDKQKLEQDDSHIDSENHIDIDIDNVADNLNNYGLDQHDDLNLSVDTDTEDNKESKLSNIEEAVKNLAKSTTDHKNITQSKQNSITEPAYATPATTQTKSKNTPYSRTVKSKYKNVSVDDEEPSLFDRLFIGLIYGVIFAIFGALFDFAISLLRSIINSGGDGSVIWLFLPILLVTGLIVGFFSGNNSGINEVTIPGEQGSSFSSGIIRAICYAIALCFVAWFVLMILN